MQKRNTAVLAAFFIVFRYVEQDVNAATDLPHQWASLVQSSSDHRGFPESIFSDN